MTSHQACLLENQIAGLVADAHSYVTAEGDNMVIVQKTCRDLVFQLGADMKHSGWSKELLKVVGRRIRFRCDTHVAPAFLPL